MPDYSKGQIYKITNLEQTKCYIGSTIQPLSVRMAGHRCHYKEYLEGKMNYLNVFKLFEEFGVENCKIYWIKDYPCSTKKELEAEEGRIQQETECVNKRMEGRTKQQWTQDNIEKVREQKYLLAQTQKYKDKRKEYDEKNKEHKLQYDRERGKIKMECECGSVFRMADKSKHYKTKKHQQYLLNQNNPQE